MAISCSHIVANEPPQFLIVCWTQEPEKVPISKLPLVLPQSWPMSFEKIELWMARKLPKTVRIFVEIEHVKNRRVTFWPERIGRVFPTLWLGHEFSQSITSHSAEVITVPPILVSCHNCHPCLQVVFCIVLGHIRATFYIFLIIFSCSDWSVI